MNNYPYGRFDAEDVVWCTLGTLAVVAALGIVVFMTYLGGYGAGLWTAACGIDKSQPHCVKQGWAQPTHNDVNLTIRKAPR